MMPTAIEPAARAFLHPVVSDTMEPTYRAGSSAVMCVPVSSYVCEGVYLIDGELYRCQTRGSYVRMWRDNAAYQNEYDVKLEHFGRNPLALVVADITAKNAIGMELLRHQEAA